ncbi:MAG: HAD family hydrolase [Acholeplasmataceae bacterium]|jgi:Cof subfamily protein (haloacid dehalogenase superfamily)
MKYYIFFDLDGSLLDRKGNLSKRTINYVEYLKNKGHEIILTTGRPFVGAIDIYHELNLNGPLITDNGAFISNPSDPNFKEIKMTMDIKDSHKLFKLVKNITISALYNVDEKVYIYQYDERLKWLFHVTKEEDIVLCDFDKVNVAPTGIIFTLLDEHQAFFETIINNHFSKITYRLWGTKDGISLYEVYVKGNTKGNAINIIIEMFKVNRDYTIAFGDDLNDFDMLQTVGHGVSMLNAKNGLELASKYQTYLTNHEDGIVDYLEKVFNL